MRIIDKAVAFIKIGAQIWSTARPTHLAAALAYYGMMSLPPLLLVMYTFGWFFLDEFILANRISDGVGQVIGPEFESLLNDAILSAVPTNLGGSWLITVIGILLLLLAASALFLELQMALNRIWDAPPSRHHGIVNFIQRRFVAILMLMGLGAVLIVPTWLEYELINYKPVVELELPVNYVEEFVIYLFFSLAIALIYKKIPNIKIAWSDVLLAAFVVSGLVLLGGWLVVSILSAVRISSPFEVFSLFSLILISVNYLSLIIIVGAVFSRCYAMVFGSMKVKTEKGNGIVSS